MSRRGKKLIFTYLKSFDAFEKATSDFRSIDFEETQIDGYNVLACYNGNDCIALYYNKAETGSVCLDFKGDAISFSELDTNWVY